MGSEVKFRYGDNIKGLADSKKEQGTFYYDKSNQRLYLYTPSGASDSATLIPIGQSIIKVSSTSALNTYDDNAFYLDDNGNLYYYNSTINVMPQQIARLSDIEEASTSTNTSIVNINTQLNTIQSSIANIEKEIGDPKVTGGANATGLYVYLDNLEANKVDNTVFEAYKTEADAKFLSADEDLFLVDGSLKYGELNNNTFKEDKENGNPYIILELKNANGRDEEKTIYIPAEDLVDVYTVTDTDTIDMTLTGLDIKADVKTANLINSTNTDTVTLSVNKDNKIETGFNTSNIIVTAKESDTVNLSVIGNQIAATVNTSNIVDEDTLKVDTNNLINVDIERLIENQDNAQVLLKYSANDDALYAELSESVKITLNNANTTGNLINKNSEAIDANKALIEANKTEFNTYKEEHATEFSTYQKTVGAYSYTENEVKSSGYFEQVQNHIDATTAALTAEETARKEADTTLQGNIDSVSSALSTERSRAQSEEASLQANIDTIYKINENNIAEGILAQEITRSTDADATLTENLNTEIQNRQNGDATLQREIETLIEDVAEDFNTANARIDTIYFKDGDAAATGLLADEITRSVQADADLDTAIQEVQANLNTEKSNLETLINNKESQINAKIDSLYKKEEITSEDGTTSTSITGTIHRAITSVSEQLSSKASELEGADRDLQEQITANKTAHEAALAEEISNRGTVISALSGAIGTYEYKTNDNNAEANVVADTYFAEVKNHIEGEAAEVRAEFAQADATLHSTITSEREAAEANLLNEIHKIYRIETTNSEIEGEQSTSSPAGLLHEETVARQAADQAIRNEFATADQGLQSQINALSGTRGNNTIESNASAIGGLESRIDTIEADYVTGNSAQETYQTIANAKADFEETTFDNGTTSYRGKIVTAYTAADAVLDAKIDALADGDVATNTSNITDLQDAIENETSGLANAHTKINSLTAAANRAYEEKENDDKSYSLNGGYIKDYIDTKAGANAQAIADLAGTNVGDNTVAGNAAAINEIAEDYMKASEAYTAENAKAITISNIAIVPRATTETPSGLCLEITYVDSAKEKSYYSIADLFTQTDFNTKMADYYTKTQADAAFLSADEDLFLVTGAVKTGSLNNGTWQDDENGDAYIYLELKNNNDAGADANKLYINASDLVDTYEASNAQNAPVEITVSDYKISADLSATTKANIKLGTDAHTAITNSATGLAAAHTAIDGINTSLTSNIGTYSYSNSTGSATGSYFGAVKSHIEAIKSYSDTEDAELKKLIDANTGNITTNTNRLADIGKFTSATETGYSGELKTLYNALNSKLTGDIGTAVSTLETGAVAGNTTNITNINSKLTAYGINDKSNNTYSLGDGVLKTYIDGKYNTNSTAISTNTQNITSIGAATGSGTTFTSSGYLQTLYNKTVADNEALSSALIGSASDTSTSSTITGAKKYSDANKAAAIEDAKNKADAAAKTVYNQMMPNVTNESTSMYHLLAREVDGMDPNAGGSGNVESKSHIDIYFTDTGKLYANKVYGSVWNDYAEYRQTHHKVRPGQCVYEKGDGSLAISYERMMPGANIVSDTFGFAIGETDECKTPLAVSGRVLAYPYESKETYNPGDAVCSGPNGTISKMTRAEIRDYPERIVGTVSEIPTYEVWGSGNIKVNGRIWIKVR